MHLSPDSYILGIKLDYFGIILLMWSSTFPLVYYSFPCQGYLQAVYLTVITVLAGLCSLSTFHPAVGGPHLGHMRAIVFGSFGFGSFLVPIVHGVLASGLATQNQQIGLAWIGLTVIFNGTGVVAYAFKVSSLGAFTFKRLTSKILSSSLKSVVLGASTSSEQVIK